VDQESKATLRSICDAGVWRAARKSGASPASAWVLASGVHFKRVLEMRRKIGRNEPCPCGSGRKFKRCCAERGARPALPPTEMESEPPPSSLPLSAYTITKIAEDPASAGKSRRLRRLIEERARTNWTIAKVALMTTAQIESQLSAYGVEHSKERFLRLAEGLSSAWAVSEIWLEHDPVKCRGKEEDFLGLAACELWKRYLSDRPSTGGRGTLGVTWPSPTPTRTSSRANTISLSTWTKASGI
jgi:SEC-C motif